MVDQPVDFSRVFVLYGALRSGTTLFRLLLDHHPDISCPGERDFMLDHLGPEGFDTGALARDRIFQASGLALPEDMDGISAIRVMLADELQRSNPVLILVMHRHLDRLLDLVPDCRFIHLVRDPRDVARSSIGMGWAGTTWHGIDHWLDTEDRWDRQSHRIADDRVHTLRYEDLIADPEACLGQVCSFVGLSFDPAMMTYTENSTYDTLDPALTFQWKTKQTPAEIGHVEHKAGALIEKLGYEASGHDAAAPAGLAKVALWVKNKRHIWRVRRQRYGLKDPLIVAVAGKLGLPQLGYGAQRRIDKALTTYLK